MRGDAILSEMFLGSFARRISVSLSRVNLMELSSVLRWKIESLRLLSMMAQYSVNTCEMRFSSCCFRAAHGRDTEIRTFPTRSLYAVKKESGSS